MYLKCASWPALILGDTVQLSLVSPFLIPGERKGGWFPRVSAFSPHTHFGLEFLWEESSKNKTSLGWLMVDHVCALGGSCGGFSWDGWLDREAFYLWVVEHGMKKGHWTGEDVHEDDLMMLSECFLWWISMPFPSWYYECYQQRFLLRKNHYWHFILSLEKPLWTCSDIDSCCYWKLAIVCPQTSCKQFPHNLIKCIFPHWESFPAHQWWHSFEIRVWWPDIAGIWISAICIWTYEVEFYWVRLVVCLDQGWLRWLAMVLPWFQGRTFCRSTPEDNRDWIWNLMYAKYTVSLNYIPIALLAQSAVILYLADVNRTTVGKVNKMEWTSRNVGFDISAFSKLY